jgi:argininosuccinate lyase
MSRRLWGGGFGASLDPAIDGYLASLGFDRRLLAADLAANRAWALALVEAGALPERAARRIDRALAAIGRETPPAAARPGSPEDIHTWVEVRLGERVGPSLASALRHGRSRNDLVATDLKIWCRASIDSLRDRLLEVLGELAGLADRCGDLAVPGYTHFRRGQPVLLAHQVLAHSERLRRDLFRLESARRGLETCPLGSGAVAGTSLPIDRRRLARRLGFRRPAANSLDAVADRDFVVDLLYAATLLMVHLSQIAEDLILATAEELGWLRLGDAAATGSSLMPQKKNPDALELMRGKSGRVLGRLCGFLATLKGLPAAYNRDLQEDKEALFDTIEATGASLAALAATLRHLDPVRARGLSEDATGGMLATDLADLLVTRGLSFAKAHAIAGRAAGIARSRGVPLHRLPAAALRRLSPRIDAAVLRSLGLRRSIGRRAAIGGTAPARVAAARRDLAAWIRAAKADA